MKRSPTEPKVSRTRVLLRQVHYQNLLLLRSPSASFFTLAVPWMLLLTLDLVYGSRALPRLGNVTSPQFYLSAMMAFAVVNACYTNVITGTVLARQLGTLRRIRCTPLPAWVYLFGRVVSVSLMGTLSVIGVMVLSIAVSSAHLMWGTMFGTVVTIAAGMVCFSLIGLAITPLINTADGSLPVSYGTILPLTFVSEVFFPGGTGPAWLQTLASYFPLQPLAHALGLNFHPDATGLGFHWRALAVLAVWSLAATIALRGFRWDPKRQETRPSRWHRRRGAPAGSPAV